MLWQTPTGKYSDFLDWPALGRLNEPRSDVVGLLKCLCGARQSSKIQVRAGNLPENAETGA
jgi:hypothetical protein